MSAETCFKFGLSSSIVYGWGAVEKVPELAASFKASNILVVTSAAIARLGLLSDMLNALHDQGFHTFLFDHVNEEPPLDIPDEAAKYGAEHHCDLIIGFGGGSVMDTAKAVSILLRDPLGRSLKERISETVSERGVPFIVVPTTAGTGSEVTSVAIFTDTNKQLKVSLVSPHIVPNAAVVDPRLTISLPQSVTAVTGIDALTHAIEAYLSRGATPLTDLFAREAIGLIFRNLEQCVKHNDRAAREAQSLASLMAGIAFANAGVGAAHALAYPLGGKYHAAHGLLVGLLMPAVIRVSATACPERVGELAYLMGCEVAGATVEERITLCIEAVAQLMGKVGFPANLKQIGMDESDIEVFSGQAILIERLLKNSRKQLSLDDIRQIYRLALGV